MAVSKLRITQGMLLPRVHETARDSANVIIIPPPQKKSMAGMMLFHQVMKCVREGEICSKPKLTDKGLWEFQMRCYSATQWIYLDVAVEVDGPRVTKIYAIVDGG